MSTPLRSGDTFKVTYRLTEDGSFITLGTEILRNEKRQGFCWICADHVYDATSWYEPRYGGRRIWMCPRHRPVTVEWLENEGVYRLHGEKEVLGHVS